jgi:hypothetical protein
MGSDPSPKCTARDRRGRVSVPDLAVAETKIQSSKHKADISFGVIHGSEAAPRSVPLRYSGYFRARGGS